VAGAPSACADLGGNHLEQQRDEFIDFIQQRAVRDMPYALIITGRWAAGSFGAPHGTRISAGLSGSAD
jgi:hypothetical protein